MAGWVAATVSNRWFVKRRGLVVGLLTASNATGQLAFLPLLASIVVAVGWRSAVLLVAAVAALVIPFVIIFMRDHPADIGLRPYGAPEDGYVAFHDARPCGQPVSPGAYNLGAGAALA